MQSYYIQYPSMYPSCVSSRPIVTSNNLIKKDINCSKECEKDIKQDSRYLKAEVVSLRFVSHSKEEITMFAQ